MIKTLRALTVRIGRRGSYLIFLAILDFVYGWSLISDTNTTLVHANIFLPPLVWGIFWIVVGAVCIVEAFAIWDRLAFSLAVAIKFMWGVAMLLSWALTGTNPHGWISATVFITFGILTSIISFWPEQRRFKIEDM